MPGKVQGILQDRHRARCECIGPVHEPAECCQVSTQEPVEKLALMNVQYSSCSPAMAQDTLQEGGAQGEDEG